MILIVNMSAIHSLFPVIDTHCDLLLYLSESDRANITSKDLGCTLPYLRAGHVRLQTLAIFALTGEGSHLQGLGQVRAFEKLIRESADFKLVNSTNDIIDKKDSAISVIAAIENASAFCDESMKIDEGITNLSKIIDRVNRLFYISFTHNTENRFGGGNFSDTGLKADGKHLLEFMNNKNIALDLSHASDALAHDSLTFIDKEKLNIPVIASHSNYRPVCDHVRNLPDEIAAEIIHRKGIIGLNFLRAFVDSTDPEKLYDHIAYGLSKGAHDAICYGADYFHTAAHPDQTRVPFFHSGHEHAGNYPIITSEIIQRFGKDIARKISYENAIRYFERTGLLK